LSEGQIPSCPIVDIFEKYEGKSAFYLPIYSLSKCDRNVRWFTFYVQKRVRLKFKINNIFLAKQDIGFNGV
jgi:hypothetical protein